MIDASSKNTQIQLGRPELSLLYPACYHKRHSINSEQQEDNPTLPKYAQDRQIEVDLQQGFQDVAEKREDFVQDKVTACLMAPGRQN